MSRGVRDRIRDYLEAICRDVDAGLCDLHDDNDLDDTVEGLVVTIWGGDE